MPSRAKASANKPAAVPEIAKPNGFMLAEAIPDIDLEMFYLIGNLRGSNDPRADRMLELALAQRRREKGNGESVD